MIELFNIFFNAVENFFTLEVYGFIAVWSAMCLLSGFFRKR